MVTFGLCKLNNLSNECERLPEVPETKGLLDPVRIIHERPFRSLWKEFFGFRSRQRRDAATARGASFLEERFRHGILRPINPLRYRLPLHTQIAAPLLIWALALETCSAPRNGDREQSNENSPKGQNAS
jgi:hypothetical protein